MGSMIGSGIFIVSADIARTVDSPALLLGAWLVTAFMTIIGALFLRRAGGDDAARGRQYVYLREGPRTAVGFLSLARCSGIQTGNHCRVAVAFGKFLGVFYPAISAKNWIWQCSPRAPSLGPDGVGTWSGLSTQSLVASCRGSHFGHHIFVCAPAR